MDLEIGRSDFRLVTRALVALIDCCLGSADTANRRYRRFAAFDIPRAGANVLNIAIRDGHYKVARQRL
jgi:hypothetical protein